MDEQSGETEEEEVLPQHNATQYIEPQRVLSCVL